MKPLNIPELLVRADAFTSRLKYDYAHQTIRIQAALARSAYFHIPTQPVNPDVKGYIPSLPIEASYVYASMAEILNMCAAHRWQIGIAMAAHMPAERERRDADLVAEALAMVGLAYGALVTTPEEQEQPAIYLALAFRLLLDLCARCGFEPADGIAAWY